MRRLLTFAVIAAAVAMVAAPAQADTFIYSSGYHRPYYREHHHRGVVFIQRAYAPPYYYAPYAPPAYVVRNNYYYPQAPVVAQAQPYCREYNGPINVGGRIQHGYGTACLQPDGSWQIID